MLGDTTQLLAPHILFSNIFFLQGIYTPTFGTDGALWSLANEFWYYLLFPLGLIALRSRAVRCSAGSARSSSVPSRGSSASPSS